MLTGQLCLIWPCTLWFHQEEESPQQHRSWSPTCLEMLSLLIWSELWLMHSSRWYLPTTEQSSLTRRSWGRLWPSTLTTWLQKSMILSSDLWNMLSSLAASSRYSRSKYWLVLSRATLLFQALGAFFFFVVSFYVISDKVKAERQIACNADIIAEEPGHHVNQSQQSRDESDQSQPIYRPVNT